MSQNAKSPVRLTIGVPVYNAEKYVRATVDSLLAQSYGDFDLIISDNASTDGTEQICRDYAARDPRVTYVRNPRNLGPAANYNISLDRSQAEFFKWNAGDDVCGPEFVKLCIEALDANPQAVLAYPRTKIIDGDGKFVRDYDYERDLSDPRPHVRLRNLVCVDHHRHGAHEMFGVMRREKLIAAGKKRCHVRADSVMLVRMVLLGPFTRVESYQFYNRDHNARSSKYLDKRLIRNGSRLSGVLGVGPLPSAEWWDVSLRGRIVFPDWRVMQEYYRAVALMPLSPAERFRCHLELARYDVRHSPKLMRDLLIAGEQAINRLFAEETSSGEQRVVEQAVQQRV